MSLHAVLVVRLTFAYILFASFFSDNRSLSQALTMTRCLSLPLIAGQLEVMQAAKNNTQTLVMFSLSISLDFSQV